MKVRSDLVRDMRVFDPFICGHLSVRIVFECKSSAEGAQIRALGIMRARYTKRDIGSAQERGSQLYSSGMENMKHSLRAVE